MMEPYREDSLFYKNVFVQEGVKVIFNTECHDSDGEEIFHDKPHLIKKLWWLNNFPKYHRDFSVRGVIIQLDRWKLEDTILKRHYVSAVGTDSLLGLIFIEHWRLFDSDTVKTLFKCSKLAHSMESFVDTICLMLKNQRNWSWLDLLERHCGSNFFAMLRASLQQQPFARIAVKQPDQVVSVIIDKEKELNTSMFVHDDDEEEKTGGLDDFEKLKELANISVLKKSHGRQGLAMFNLINELKKNLHKGFLQRENRVREKLKTVNKSYPVESEFAAEKNAFKKNICTLMEKKNMLAVLFDKHFKGDIDSVEQQLNEQLTACRDSSSEFYALCRAKFEENAHLKNVNFEYYLEDMVNQEKSARKQVILDEVFSAYTKEKVLSIYFSIVEQIGQINCEC